MSLTRRGESEGEERCEKCGGPMALRPLYPYPTVVQLLFGLSFLLFLVFHEKIQSHKDWVSIWFGVQVALGVILIRRRVRARKKVLRCIQCP